MAQSIGLLTLLTLAAYLNSFSVPLLFDDFMAIPGNPSVRDLRNFAAVLAPPNDVPTAGRPLLNLSFAVNYALGGEAVAGYHVINLLLHLVAVFTLFGVTRRVLQTPVVGPRLNAAARPLALVIAAIWAVHPVHTATVTYISQRAEVLMAVCWLLTLYWFVRSVAAPQEPVWGWLSIIACACGMLSKETMVTAPLAVLLCDRTFFPGTLREAMRLRWRYYAGLALSWGLLAALMVGSRINARGVGYHEDVGAWTYALTQCRVVLDYARLALWPHPLVFDYGLGIMAKNLAEVWAYVLAMVAGVSGTVFALIRKSPLGFLPAIFLLALAPTSSVVPVIHQPMAENRMYLPVAAVVVGVIIAIYLALSRRQWALFAAIAVVFAGLTVRRNFDYGSAVRLWRDTVSKNPSNYRAHNYLAGVLRDSGDIAGLIQHSQIALTLSPDNDVAHNNLGAVYISNPATLSQAAFHFTAALRVRPGYAPVLTNLGNALVRIPGREEEGLARLREAGKAMPQYADAHTSLATALMARPGGVSEAVQEFAEVVKLDPKNSRARVNLCVALAAFGNFDEAARHGEIAVQLAPDYPDAHLNLANALLRIPGGHLKAIAHYREAIRLRPAFPEAWFNLGLSLEPIPGQEREAFAALTEAIRLQPDFRGGREMLDRVRAKIRSPTIGAPALP